MTFWKVNWWFCLSMAAINSLIIIEGVGDWVTFFIGLFCWGACWLDHVYGVTFKEKNRD